ncbi:hypothetical protein GGS20DRAFT_588867 [Poronia punctata]|nr:hypothetical protein GGS20DRAFT_588867 [Poronia punctata]
MSGRGAAPGANSRGRGGKFKKFTRGGGKHFSRDLGPRDDDGFQVSMWSRGSKGKGKGSDEDSEDDSDEDSEEDSDDDSDDAAGPSGAQQELTREERKAAKKAQKDAAAARRKAGQVQVGDLPSASEDEDDDDDDDEDMPANPNHSKAAQKQARAPQPDVDATAEAVKNLSVKKDPSTLSRREREEIEKRRAAAHYQKLHAAGKTDEAKNDLKRLEEIRRRRAEEHARNEAEKAARQEVVDQRAAEIKAREEARRERAMGKPAKKGKK